ncbi:hypothetical protein ACKWRH_31275 [Bradyrhizobium sp. Pa8]|uniref:hypothetical protein n=1 Tax=Bradyrhizobium sp. Pa8 TaxID=3386552 RepID=UPI00403FB4C5
MRTVSLLQFAWWRYGCRALADYRASGGVNGGLGGSEARPRNIALLAWIKY